MSSSVLITAIEALIRPSMTSCIENSRASGSMPRENVRQAWGSRSTTSTRWPSSASAAPIEATVVVLATPPFWLAMAMIRVIPGPCFVGNFPLLCTA